jgi:hypothetical protein
MDLRCRYNLVDICREMSFVAADDGGERLLSAQALSDSENADPVSGDTIRFQHSCRFTDFAYQ